MKRIFLRTVILALICAMLLPGFAFAEKNFSPVNAEDARLQALNCLILCAFDAEYGDPRGYLVRWEDPIYLYIGGNPTAKDIQKVDEMILQLAYRVPNMPNIYRTNNEYESNVTMYFVPMDQLGNYVSGYVEGNWGMVTYHYMNSVITSAEIGIATDVTNQMQRNHLILEEFINGIGLGNDQYEYSDSIVYQPWSEVQQPSEIDWLMLNMVYSPELKAGMTADEAWNAMHRKITER